MSIVLVAHESGANRNTVVTPSVDSTGANLIVIGDGWYHGISADPDLVFDTIGGNNYASYTALTKRSVGNISVRLWYSLPTVVGAGHFATVSGTDIYQGTSFSTWSGASVSPFDVENGATGSSIASLATGSVSPSEDNCLIVSMVAHEDGSGISIDSGFTLIDTIAYSSGANEGTSLAYLIQTTASSVNPTWSWSSGPTYAATAIAVFKGPGGGGGGTARGIPFGSEGTAFSGGRTFTGVLR